MNELLMH